MRSRKAWEGGAFLAAVVLMMGVPAGAVGTIDQAGATVASGTAPSRGALTIDPAAPGVAPPSPSIGAAPAAPSLTGAMPAFAGGGDGSDGAFMATADTTLAGGTWNFTSFTVQNQATVGVTGAATILVQGDALIFGAVVSVGAGESLAFRTGGDFQLRSGPLPCRVETMGAGADVLIAAGAGAYIGDGTAGEVAIVRAMNGSVELRVHGTDLADDHLSIVSGQVRAPAGSVTLLSNASMEIGGLDVSTPGDALAGGGSFTARAFGARLLVSGYGEVDAANGAPAVLECAGRMDFYGYLFSGGTTTVRLAAGQGPLTVGGSMGAYDGDVAILSGGDLLLSGTDAAISVYGAGNLAYAAVGAFGLTAQDARSYTSDGDLSVVAGDSVRLERNAWLYSGRDLSVSAPLGSVTLQDTSELTAWRAVDIRASVAVFIGLVPPAAALARPPAGGPYLVSLGGSARVRGDSVSIACSPGGVTLDAVEARATGGGFSVLADGPVEAAQTVSAAGAVVLASLQGDVDVEQATVITDHQIATGTPASGAITIESWDPAGTVRASGATVRSGDADGSSGAVSLLVHGSGGGAPSVVESFLLPKRIAARMDGARSRLVAAGFFDMGPEALDLTAPTTVTVGDLVFTFGGLTPDGKGLKFVHAEAGLQLLVVPARSGSSRATFRLKASGESLEGAFDPEGTLDLGFDNGQVEGAGTVRLEGGRYVLGRKRGALMAPNLWLAKGKAVLKGDGRDSLALTAGLATQGGTPEEAPDLEIGFGGGYTASVPGSAFTRRGDIYSATEGGVTAVLDYRRETLKVVAKEASLGEFPDGAQAVSVTLTLGGETREVRVRMVRRGARLAY